MDEILEKRIRSFLLPKINSHFVRYKKKYSAYITFAGYDYYEEADTEDGAKENIMLRLLAVKNVDTLYLKAKK